MNINQVILHLRLIPFFGLLFLLSSFDALANKPVSYTFEYPLLLEIVDCGDFKIMDNVWEVDDIKDFYDKDGNFVRSQILVSADDDLYRDDQPEGIHLT